MFCLLSIWILEVLGLDDGWEVGYVWLSEDRRDLMSEEIWIPHF
jgi:hypothetical protein